MIIAFIPVRGGSKSIPLKNIKSFCGQPLVYWCVQELQKVGIIDKIIIATDSVEIKQTVLGFNFSKIIIYDRKPENAIDTASTESVMLEYINSNEINDDDTFMLVQATSPLTKAENFKDGLQLYLENKYDSVLSCVRNYRFFWNTDGTSRNYDYKKRPRRQEFDGTLMENGAFYINSVKNIKEFKNRLCGKIGIYEMPSYTGFEIDEPDDWQILEKLMEKHILHKNQTDYSKIKIVITDVDGVLTDSGMYYSENGDELKKFNTHDGMGFSLLQKNGIKTAIITSEKTKIVERRAKKLKIDYLYQGVMEKDKLNATLEICEKEKFSLDEVAYIRDDINCKELLSKVGFPFCPSDAVEEIKNINNIKILRSKGGEGVFRELCSVILYGI